MAPSFTTTAARAPLRKSESILLSESGVMLRFFATGALLVCDARTVQLCQIGDQKQEVRYVKTSGPILRKAHLSKAHLRM